MDSAPRAEAPSQKGQLVMGSAHGQRSARDRALPTFVGGSKEAPEGSIRGRRLLPSIPLAPHLLRSPWRRPVFRGSVPLSRASPTHASQWLFGDCGVWARAQPASRAATSASGTKRRSRAWWPPPRSRNCVSACPRLWHSRGCVRDEEEQGGGR